ncbi:MAG TPA: EAL domain-containing protein [Steroidobacteraceae bacterium]|nr:EAL domain-containing protein [Steroidobacteraceae bacterium]
MSPSSHAPTAIADDPDATVETESVFQRFREAVPNVPLHNVTLHDAKGERLWGSQRRATDGIDQALRDALEAFQLGISYPYLKFPLDGERTAVMLPSRAPDGSLAAVAALVIDTATLDPSIDACASFLTRPVRAALKAIGAALSGQDWPAPVAAAAPSAPPAAAPPRSAPPPGRRASDPPAASAELDRTFATIRDEAIELHIQPLARLRSSARTRRYEVLLRSRTEGTSAAPQALLRAAREHGLDSMIDRRVISQLMAWLVKRRSTWKADPPMFSVNLSATALGEDHFFKFVDLCIKKAALPAGILGFEIAESACRAAPERAARALAFFRELGCPVVLDDFSMHTDVLPLLEQPGIKLVKLDAQLTTGALGERMREARIVSIVQAMRVLGMQTVAKRVEDEAEREWLTALGVDFVQSFRFEPPRRLEDFG